MRNIYKVIFSVLLTLLLGCSDKIISQNSSNYNSLKKDLSINDKDFEKIKDNKAIIEELKLSVKDSLVRIKASSILDSFFDKEYSKKRLLTILEMNRVFKGKNYRIVNSEDIDSSKALIINDIEDLKELKKKIKVKVSTKTKVDSTNNNITAKSVSTYTIGEKLKTPYDKENFDIKILQKDSIIKEIIIKSDMFKTKDGFGVGSNISDIVQKKSSIKKDIEIKKGEVKVTTMGKNVFFNGMWFIDVNKDGIIDFVWLMGKE